MEISIYKGKLIIMMSESHRGCMQTKGVVVGRVLMGLLFFFSGLGILFMTGPAGTAAFYESVGVPMAGIAVWLVVIAKLGAGGALILGKRVGCAAATLIVFTLLATLVAHRDINDPNLFKNLAIIGGLLYVVAYGAGSWSSGQAKASNVCSGCGKDKSACTCNTDQNQGM